MQRLMEENREQFRVLDVFGTRLGALEQELQSMRDAKEQQSWWRRKNAGSAAEGPLSRSNTI
jgi:hypothetical protein